MTITLIIMMVFVVAFLCCVIGLALQIFKNDSILIPIIGMVVSFLLMCIDAPFLDIKPPEIYTTNGNSVVENSVKIKSDPLFKVYYTTIPYADPRENGEIYKEPIELTHSMSVSARVSFFFDFFWSDNVSIDLIVGEESVMYGNSGSPGSSISEISVALNRSSYFPGNIVYAEDLIVSGTTIAGEEVIITEFVYEPFELAEGLNTIEVRYLNLSAFVKINVVQPSLTRIAVKYIGDEKHTDEKFSEGDFVVTGFYEDGTSKEITDFQIEPISFSESGSHDITIRYEECAEALTLEVLPKEYLFDFVSEMHTPTGSYDPNVYTGYWEKDEDYAIDGKTYGYGIKLEIHNWMSGLMGNGTDFRETVTSNIYINVNQDVLAKTEPEKRYFEGCFVIHKDTNGSTTTANISVYADDDLAYQSGDINAVSTKIPAFKIPVNGVDQIRIETVAKSSGNPFIIGCIVK